jgi:ketosteroid isomerase-like protein
MSHPVAVARACYDAYATNDRQKIEALVADDYRFTSPLDNGLDRAAYFRICWPNAAKFTAFDIVQATGLGDRALVVYEATTRAGKRFRNVELHTVRDGKLVATEVYFGWNLPHDVPPGQHRDPA